MVLDGHCTWNDWAFAAHPAAQINTIKQHCLLIFLFAILPHSSPPKAYWLLNVSHKYPRAFGFRFESVWVTSIPFVGLVSIYIT